MPMTLIETKLYVPRRGAKLVSRPRLLGMLDDGQESKLTLVCAPAGFGKSNLLTDWIHSTGQPVAWLSADESDNEPGVFLSYMVAALQRIDPGAGARLKTMLGQSMRSPIESGLAMLVGDLHSSEKKFTLVIDDYHVLTNPAIHEGVDFFLAKMPGNVRTVISTRSDPPISLARLRVGKEMTEIRAADLRFNAEEVSAFLADVMGVHLAEAQIASLEAKTEGWIASLQLAALSLQRNTDSESFIEEFSGSHRHVFDYLVDEVLERLPVEEQDFLIKTSVLERLSAALCDEVLGIDSSHEMLMSLEKQNMFLIPLDDDRVWYRYHHLFGDFLRKRLSQMGRGLASELHRKAALWYSQYGSYEVAFAHAISADDPDLAAAIVEPHAFTMISDSKIVPFLALAAKLPGEVSAAHPRILLSKAWALLLTGEVAASARIHEEMEPQLARIDDEETRTEFEGHILGMKTHIARGRGEYESAIKLAIEALTRVPKSQALTRAPIALALGIAYMRLGKLDDALVALDQAEEDARISRLYYVTFASYSSVGEILAMQGRFSESIAVLEQIIEDSVERGGGKALPAAEYCHLSAARSHIELGGLEAAENHARLALQLHADMALIGGDAAGHFALAMIHIARSDFDAAEAEIALAEQAHEGHRGGTPETASAELYRIACPRLRLDIARANIDGVKAWLEQNLEPTEKSGLFRYFLATSRIRALIAAGETAAAGRLLDTLVDDAVAQGRLGHLAELHVLRAVILSAGGEGGGAKGAGAGPTSSAGGIMAAPDGAAGSARLALDELGAALTLAEPQGRIGLFTGFGNQMAILLRKYQAERAPSDYAAKLLRLISTRGDSRSAPGANDASASGSRTLAAPARDTELLISPRELEVLRLLGEGRRYQEIADHLYVSLNTVRAHTKNIYMKLQVNSGSQAVRRATDLGLL